MAVTRLSAHMTLISNTNYITQSNLANSKKDNQQVRVIQEFE